jgi:hypothetical protein
MARINNCGAAPALRPSIIPNLQEGIDTIGRCEHRGENTGN